MRKTTMRLLFVLFCSVAAAGCPGCDDDGESPSPTGPTATNPTPTPNPNPGPQPLTTVRIDVTRTNPDPQFPGTCKTNAIRVIVSGSADLLRHVIAPALQGNDSYSGGSMIVRERSCGWQVTVPFYNAQPRYFGADSTAFATVAVTDRVDFALEGLSFLKSPLRFVFSSGNNFQLDPSHLRANNVNGEWRIQGALNVLATAAPSSGTLGLDDLETPTLMQRSLFGLIRSSNYTVLYTSPEGQVHTVTHKF